MIIQTLDQLSVLLLNLLSDLPSQLPLRQAQLTMLATQLSTGVKVLDTTIVKFMVTAASPPVQLLRALLNPPYAFVASYIPSLNTAIASLQAELEQALENRNITLAGQFEKALGGLIEIEGTLLELRNMLANLLDSLAGEATTTMAVVASTIATVPSTQITLASG